MSQRTVSRTKGGPGPRAAHSEGRHIVDVGCFVEATRDSGYRGPAAAVSEFIDNSIEAGASEIRVEIRLDTESSAELCVTDNGCGMTMKELSYSLQFAGSSRFQSRAMMGRYGMGLPNAALSLGRRVDVYTWRSAGRVLRVHLDLDEVSQAGGTTIAAPTRSRLPSGIVPPSQGTLVRITKCDRLATFSSHAAIRELRTALGQRFRHFLWRGTKLYLNDTKVKPVDPLFVRGPEPSARAAIYGEPLHYEIRTDPRDPDSPIGVVEVTFAELPVDAYFDLSNTRKRQLGITGGAGISIVRSGREVDYDWLFMGAKRRENYDDWWRAEVRFEPILDEAFGITHTKQHIHPTPALEAILAADCEAIARTLNARVRAAHTRAKRRSAHAPAETLAARADRRLPPLLVGKLPVPDVTSSGESLPGWSYRILDVAESGGDLYRSSATSGRVTLELNEHHPFVRRLTGALDSGDRGRRSFDPVHVELLLLAVARAELGTSAEDLGTLDSFRTAWSQILAAYVDEMTP